MAKVFLVTAAELDKLVESLELVKLRTRENSHATKLQSLDEMHRTFHYHVVRWVQDVAGHKGG